MQWIRSASTAARPVLSLPLPGSRTGLRRTLLWSARKPTRQDAPKKHSKVEELRCSNGLLKRGEELRARLAQDGYILFTNLLPRDQVLGLRGKVVGALKELRWIDAAQPSAGSPFSATCSRVPAETEEGQLDAHDWPIFDIVQKMEAFHALPHAPPLLSALAEVFGEPPLMHPRHILRVHFPHQGYHRTLPHQDYPYVQGTSQTLTCWCPLGEAPLSHGPLAVLIGSHKRGVQRLIRSGGCEDSPLMVDLAPFHGLQWGSRNFRPGDVLMMHSQLVHMGLDNASDQVRLSLDCRAQPESQPVSERALQPNWTRQSWADIYGAEAWANPSLQYYWRSRHLNTVQEEKFDGLAFHTVFDPADY